MDKNRSTRTPFTGLLILGRIPGEPGKNPRRAWEESQGSLRRTQESLGRIPGEPGKNPRRAWEESQESLGRIPGEPGKNPRRAWEESQESLGRIPGEPGKNPGEPGKNPRRAWEESQESSGKPGSAQSFSFKHESPEPSHLLDLIPSYHFQLFPTRTFLASFLY